MPAPVTTPTQPAAPVLSAAELEAERAAGIARRATAYQAQLTRLQDTKRKEDARHVREEAEAEAAHAAEIERRHQLIQRATHERLAPLLRAFREDDTRENARLVAAAWHELNSESRNLTGYGLHDFVLPHVFVAIAIADDPSHLGRASCRDFFAHSAAPAQWMGQTMGACATVAHQALSANAGPSTLIPALNALDAAVERALSCRQEPRADSADRVQTDFFGGTNQAKEAAHAKLDKAEQERRNAANAAEFAEIRRARSGEDVPGKPAGWLEAARRASAAIFGPTLPLRTPGAPALTGATALADVEVPPHFRGP
jgi:hypothetical protein